MNEQLKYIEETIRLNSEELVDGEVADELITTDLMVYLGYNIKRDRTVRRINDATGGKLWLIKTEDGAILVKTVGLGTKLEDFDYKKFFNNYVGVLVITNCEEIGVAFDKHNNPVKKEALLGDECELIEKLKNREEFMQLSAELRDSIMFEIEPDMISGAFCRKTGMTPDVISSLLNKKLNKVAELEGKLASLQKQVESSNTTSEESGETVSVEEFEALREELDTVKDKYCDLSKEYSDAQSELESLRAKVDELTDENNRLKEENTGIAEGGRKSVDEYAEQISQLIKQNSEFKDTIDTLNAKIKSMEQEELDKVKKYDEAKQLLDMVGDDETQNRKYTGVLNGFLYTEETLSRFIGVTIEQLYSIEDSAIMPILYDGDYFNISKGIRNDALIDGKCIDFDISNMYEAEALEKLEKFMSEFPNNVFMYKLTGTYNAIEDKEQLNDLGDAGEKFPEAELPEVDEHLSDKVCNTEAFDSFGAEPESDNGAFIIDSEDSTSESSAAETVDEATDNDVEAESNSNEDIMAEKANTGEEKCDTGEKNFEEPGEEFNASDDIFDDSDELIEDSNEEIVDSNSNFDNTAEKEENTVLYTMSLEEVIDAGRIFDIADSIKYFRDVSDEQQTVFKIKKAGAGKTGAVYRIICSIVGICGGSYYSMIRKLNMMSESVIGDKLSTVEFEYVDTYNDKLIKIPGTNLVANTEAVSMDELIREVCNALSIDTANIYIDCYNALDGINCDTIDNYEYNVDFCLNSGETCGMKVRGDIYGKTFVTFGSDSDVIENTFKRIDGMNINNEKKGKITDSEDFNSFINFIMSVSNFDVDELVGIINSDGVVIQREDGESEDANDIVLNGNTYKLVDMSNWKFAKTAIKMYNLAVGSVNVIAMFAVDSGYLDSIEKGYDTDPEKFIEAKSLVEYVKSIASVKKTAQ